MPPMRVLVVDDEPAIRELLAEYLRGRGLEVSTVPDGERAQARITADPPDVVLTDLKLPGIDGLEVVRAANAQSIPCVLMTGYGTVETAIEAFSQGVSAYILKPFRLRDLYTQLVRGQEAAARRRSLEWSEGAVALLRSSEMAHDAESAEALVPALTRLLRALPGSGATVRQDPTGSARPLGTDRWIDGIPDLPEARGLVRAVHTALVRAGR